ncbi:MAG: tripartite tricarboxylate transporter TctB family protein [Syntrophomonadaceae bacterium]|jgi:hypothetical protein
MLDSEKAPNSDELHNEEIKKTRGELYFYGLFFLIMALFFKESLQLEGLFPYNPSGNGFLPQLMTITGMVLSIALSVQLLRSGYKEVSPAVVLNYLFNKPLAGFMVLIVIYVLITPYIHFFPATMVFLACSMLFLHRSKPKRLLLIAVCTAISFQLVFVYLFRVFLP